MPIKHVTAESPKLELSVIIVTWNCELLLANCLDSLLEHSGDIEYEVIVVDNASNDGTLLMLERKYPAVRTHANNENTGFAKANNQGMAMAKAPLICLLNPDTLLHEPDTLARIRQRLITHPEIDAAGCRLVFPDGSHQVGDAGYAPDIRSVLAHALLLSRLAPKLFRGLFLQDGRIKPPFGKVAWVCGACTILRQELFLRVGGLDESYFLYGEDLEWGCRMTNAGALVAYLPDINIVHLQGGTQKGKRLPSTRWIDGLARLFIDQNLGRNWLLFRSSMACGFLARSIIYALKPGTSRSAEMLHFAKHVWTLKTPTSTDPKQI